MSKNMVKVQIGGLMIECTPAQALKLVANAKDTTPSKPVVDWEKVREAQKKAVIISEGDSSAEYIHNVLQATKGHEIHVVFSGLNREVRKRFSDDPRVITDLLEKKGIITLRPVKGGAMIALKE